MKRVRLYELAKELKLETRQVLADARRFGAMASSPSSSVDERTANRIRELYYPKKPAATPDRPPSANTNATENTAMARSRRAATMTRLKMSRPS